MWQDCTYPETRYELVSQISRLLRVYFTANNMWQDYRSFQTRHWLISKKLRLLLCRVFNPSKTLQSTCSVDLRDVELKNSKSFGLRPINAIKYMATPSPNCQIWKTSFLNVSANFKFSKFWGQQYLTFEKYDGHIMFIGMAFYHVEKKFHFSSPIT